ncbi:MAG TPA: nuclear transport factor 2 family protein [Polyangiales bacterium]
MDNTDVIKAFFAAFRERNAEAMGRLYHPEASFSDPVFGKLDVQQTRAMWHMLCSRGKDLKVELVRCEADANSGSADWEATYTFLKTGKLVHNEVHSRLRFKDGLICAHDDSFDFWRWASMALGASGRLLGWTPIIKNAVRKQARHNLDNYRPLAATA